MNKRVRSYVNRIRNKNKKSYARRYYAWLQSGESGPEPDEGNLSAMAAQGVRMSLAELTGNKYW